MANARPSLRTNPIDFIKNLADVAGGLGDWVANGSPPSGSIPAEIQQRYRDHCDAWSNSPTWIQRLDPGARLFLSNACKPWLDANNSGDPVPVSPAIPFSGGQCPGVTYNVNYTRVYADFGGSQCQFQNSASSTATASLIGPISGFAIEPFGSAQCGPLGVEYVAFDQTGRVVLQNPSSPRGSNVPGCTLTINEVARADGLPDDCGNPIDFEPNPNPRPDPGLDPEDEPFEREPGRPVLPMPEIPNPFGDPIQLPNFPLPRIDGPSPFPVDEPDLAPPGDPGVPETISGDEDTEGEAGDGETLTGVLIEVAVAPNFARVVQNVSVPTYIGACYVYLGWEDQLDLQPEGQFLVDGQFFAAIPGMTHYRVRSAVGYTLTVTPFYAPTE